MKVVLDSYAMYEESYYDDKIPMLQKWVKLFYILLQTEQSKS